MTTLRRFLASLIDLFFPCRCPVCRGKTGSRKEQICFACFCRMPLAHFHLYPENSLWERVCESVPTERTGGLFHYEKHAPYRHIIHRLKYSGDTSLAIYMGRRMARHLGTEFFKGIDLIIPVPLSRQRLRKRGYNQCELIAQGISMATGLPVVTDCLTRIIDNDSQTLHNQWERRENVRGIFRATPSAHITLQGKHLLLIDDLITTGATISECAITLKTAAPKCRISIASLGVTR